MALLKCLGTVHGFDTFVNLVRSGKIGTRRNVFIRNNFGRVNVVGGGNGAAENDPFKVAPSDMNG